MATKDQVFKYVSENPGCKMINIAQALNTSAPTASRYAQILEAEGKLMIVKKGVSKFVSLKPAV